MKKAKKRQNEREEEEREEEEEPYCPKFQELPTALLD